MARGVFLAQAFQPGSAPTKGLNISPRLPRESHRNGTLCPQTGESKEASAGFQMDPLQLFTRRLPLPAELGMVFLVFSGSISLPNPWLLARTRSPVAPQAMLPAKGCTQPLSQRRIKSS